MSTPSTIGHFERVRALHATPRFVVLGGVRALAATELRIHDHVADKPVAAVTMPAHVLALAGNSDVVVAGCADGWVRVVELATGKLVAEHRVHEGPVLAVAFRDGAVVTGGADGAVRLLDASSGDARASWQGSRPIRAVAFAAAAGGSPSGDALFAAGDDGVVRMLTRSSAPVGAGAFRCVREMPGHDGPVLALAVLPRDGRLASGGDDGTIRLWYLSGDVDSEIKGNDQDAHKGAVTALVHVAGEPMPGQDATDRLFSASADGTIKAWRLEDRKKPRTLDVGGGESLYALAFVGAPAFGAAPGERGAGTLFAAGDQRTVARVEVAGGGQLADGFAAYGHGFQQQEQELSGARPKRAASVALLFTLYERESRDLLAKQMAGDKEAELRALVVTEAARSKRQDLRDAVKSALDDGDKAVRAAAFSALAALDSDAGGAPAGARGVLVAVRAALKSKHADIRKRALEKLVSLAGTSPLVAGLVADKLTDVDSTVRLAALSSLVALDLAEHRDPPVDALVTAFARGTPDVRAWVLVRAARGGLLAHTALMTLALRALDDDDADVRRTAFALRVLVRKQLADKLESATDLTHELGSTFKEALKRVAVLENGGDAALVAAVSDEDVGLARMVLPSHPEPVPSAGADPATPWVTLVGDAGIEPLLVAMACRTPDTALRGALALAVLGDGRALGALLQLSREGDPALRRGAVAGLRALADERAKKRLAWMLDDADASVRSAAYEALAKLDADSPLVAADVALRSSHEDIRARGLELLIKVGSALGPSSSSSSSSSPNGSAVAQAGVLLEEAIEDESAKVRAEAFRTLWSWHTSGPNGGEPRKAIDRALDARFADTRIRAVEELNARAKARGTASDEVGADAAWARAKLVDTIEDVDGAVGKAAFDAAQRHLGEKDPAPILAGLESTSAAVRAVAARASRKVPAASELRSALSKALLDDDISVRTHALESLDVLFPNESGPLITGLQGKHLDLRVRAGELLALRRDEQLIDAMRAIIDDKDLARVVGPDAAALLRRRATGALATLGSKRNVKYLQALLKDPANEPGGVGVREEAARGLASSCRPGDEPILLDAMGHGEIWVRSWAAEGLARLGDVRALPVLVGTLRHEHLPIRRGAILAFAAFGPDGYGGMLQGLEDKDEELEQIVFAIVLAHDLQLLRRNRAPDFLATALSSQRAEVRFAAARSLELRIDPALFLAHLVEVLTPPKPDKAGDMTPDKGWPAQDERSRILRGLAEALGSDVADRRYAAAQALLHKKNPRDYFRVAADVAKLRPSSATVVPDTRPRPVSLEGDPDSGAVAKPRGARGLFRKLFASDSPSSPSSAGGGTDAAGNVLVATGEQDRLRRLAFGAYVGLLRQVVAGDESQRVRRDAVDRIVDLGKNHLGVAAGLPPLVRALDDAHHLVRKAALAGLRTLVGDGEAQRLGLASPHADVAKAVLDELAARYAAEKSAAAKDAIARGLSSENAEVRKAAFELLEKLAPKEGPAALEPLLLALSSPYADLRLGVLERLASSNDARVVDALGKALGSDHDDLRLRAAELLAKRGEARAADVLGAFLRHDNAPLASRALAALASMRHTASVAALSSRIDDVIADGPVLIPLVDAVAQAGRVPAPSAAHPHGADSAATRVTVADLAVAAASLAVLVKLFDHERDDVKGAAFNGCLTVLGAQKRERSASLELLFAAPAARARDANIRRRAAEELDRTHDDKADELLLALFVDRDTLVRAAAVTSYATRVRRGASSSAGPPVAPLLEVLKRGQRELVLPAGEGVAAKHNPAALVPLLLVARAGEPGERERALLALGTLGDPRALAELELIAGGGTAEAPAEPSMKVAATEALGRLHNQLSDHNARARIWELLDACAGERDALLLRAAIRGLVAVGDARARARIESVLGETNADAGALVLAANALRLIGDASNEAGLAQALVHGNVDVAKAAKRALDHIFTSDKVKIALLSVASQHADISAPAASFLAEEGAPADLLQRLPELKSDDLRERIRFGLLRRGLLPAVAVAALLDDPRVRARANGAFLVGGRAITFTGEARSLIARALAKSEERSAAGYLNAAPAEKANELSTWLRVWVAARKLGDSSLLDVSKRRIHSAPAPVRAAAVRYVAAVGGSGDVTAIEAAVVDVDGAVRQAAAFALKGRAPDTARALAKGNLGGADPMALAIVVDKADRTPLVSSAIGRAVVVPSLWRDKDAGALLDRAQAGDQGAVQALGWLDHDIARAALYELAGDDDDPAAEPSRRLELEQLRKTAYRALRRNNRRKAAAAKAAAKPMSLTMTTSTSGDDA